MSGRKFLGGTDRSSPQGSNKPKKWRRRLAAKQPLTRDARRLLLQFCPLIWTVTFYDAVFSRNCGKPPELNLLIDPASLSSITCGVIKGARPPPANANPPSPNFRMSQTQPVAFIACCLTVSLMLVLMGIWLFKATFTVEVSRHAFQVLGILQWLQWQSVQMQSCVVGELLVSTFAGDHPCRTRFSILPSNYPFPIAFFFRT